MALFSFKSGKRVKTPERPAFDPETEEAAVRCSICTGEQVAGFQHKSDGRFVPVQLLQSERDLDDFRVRYGLEGQEIKKIY